MKRPLFPCVIGLVLGEAAAITFGFRGVTVPVLLFLLTGGLFLLWRKGRNRFVMPFGAQNMKAICLYLFSFSVFALAGVLLFFHAWVHREPLQGQTLPMEGIIRGKIAFLQVDEEGEYTITLENVQVLSGKRENGIRQSVRGSCMVYHVKEGDVTLWPGDWIRCEGELIALSAPTNPGEFNSEVYYRSRGVSCQFFADSGWLEYRKPFSLARLACVIRRKMDAVYAATMGKEHAALLDAMVLGDKSALLEEQKERYEENGVAHLLSVSGLHVSILAGSWYRFLRGRGLPYTPACAGGMALLVFYGCLTGFGNSIVRAVLMYAVYLGAQYFGAQYDMTSSMSLAGILMLLESPWRLLEGGCQMSFAAIFAIGYVLPWVKELAEQRKGEEDGRLRSLPVLRRKMADALLASIVISAVTMPVVLRVFFTFSPYSILINLLVIPCMTPMMVSAILAGIAGLCVPSEGWLLLRGVLLPAKAVLYFYDYVLEPMRRLPGAVLTPGCPSLFVMVLLYLLEGLVLYLWYRRCWRLAFRAALVALCGLLMAPTGDTLRITMLDVGQGECILLRLPGGENVLLDGGSTSRSKVGQYVILPALQYYGISTLDYVIVTHLDADHVSGIAELLEAEYPIRRLILPAGEYAEGETGGDEANRTAEQWETSVFVTKAEDVGVEVVQFQRGDAIRFPDTALLRCLHPYAGFRTDDRNAASLVFHLRYGEYDALFTGDLEATGEEALCRYAEEEDAEWPAGFELLKVAHHGSKYSSNERFLARVSPAAALLSSGENNRYGHPHKETLARLKKYGAMIAMTREKGAITVETDGREWEIRGFLQGTNE